MRTVIVTIHMYVVFSQMCCFLHLSICLTYITSQTFYEYLMRNVVQKLKIKQRRKLKNKNIANTSSNTQEVSPEYVHTNNLHILHIRKTNNFR